MNDQPSPASGGAEPSNRQLLTEPLFPPSLRKPLPLHQALIQKEAEMSSKLEHLRDLLKLIKEHPELSPPLNALLQLL